MIQYCDAVRSCGFLLKIQLSKIKAEIKVREIEYFLW